MPTKPPSIGMSTSRAEGAIIRADLARATSSESGMSKSRISRGGIAPPHGLIRPARSSSSTERPADARSAAAVAPGGTAAHHHHVIGGLAGSAHGCAPPNSRSPATARPVGTAARLRPLARTAATRKTAASMANTIRNAGRGIVQERRAARRRRTRRGSRRWRRRRPGPRPTRPCGPLPSRSCRRRRGPSSSRWPRRRRPRWRGQGRRTVGASGQDGPATLAAPRPPRARAEPTQPPMVQRRIHRDLRSPKRAPRRPTSDHADKHAAVLHGIELGRLAGVEMEDEACERLQDQFLGAVGQHGDEDEDREPPRQRVGADLGDRVAEAGAGRRRGRLPPPRLTDSPSARQTAARVSRKPTPATPEATIARRWPENGCSSAPLVPAQTTIPTIISIQVIEAAAGRRSGATRVASSASSEVPAAPTPPPIME